jgi:dTDP-4-dehydrorhamnose reductase
MHVLVLGATGMLGHVLARRLLAEGHRVAGTVRGDIAGSPVLRCLIEAGLLALPLDLAAPAALARAFDAAAPEVVVNCAGVIKQKAEAADMAALVRMNALLPHEVAAEAGRGGARLIQLSTDCVFSGARGLYAEDAAPDPVDAYGRSKLLGEVGPPHLTLRCSMVGWQLRGAESLVEWFWAQRGGSARGYRRAFFSGFTTPALARILAAVLAGHPRLAGLYHLAAPRISKFDLLEGLNARLGRPVDLVPDDRPAIDRSLDGRRFAAAAAMALPDWPAMLDELAEQKAEYHGD